MNPQSISQILGGLTGQTLIPQVPGTPGYTLTPPIAQPTVPGQMPQMPGQSPYPASMATQAPASLASLIGGLVRG